MALAAANKFTSVEWPILAVKDALLMVVYVGGASEACPALAEAIADGVQEEPWDARCGYCVECPHIVPTTKYLVGMPLSPRDRSQLPSTVRESVYAADQVAWAIVNEVPPSPHDIFKGTSVCALANATSALFPSATSAIGAWLDDAPVAKGYFRISYHAVGGRMSSRTWAHIDGGRVLGNHISMMASLASIESFAKSVPHSIPPYGWNVLSHFNPNAPRVLLDLHTMASDPWTARTLLMARRMFGNVPATCAALRAGGRFLDKTDESLLDSGMYVCPVTSIVCEPGPAHVVRCDVCLTFMARDIQTRTRATRNDHKGNSIACCPVCGVPNGIPVRQWVHGWTPPGEPHVAANSDTEEEQEPAPAAVTAQEESVEEDEGAITPPMPLATIAPPRTGAQAALKRVLERDPAEQDTEPEKAVWPSSTTIDIKPTGPKLPPLAPLRVRRRLVYDLDDEEDVVAFRTAEVGKADTGTATKKARVEMTTETTVEEHL